MMCSPGANMCPVTRARAPSSSTSDASSASAVSRRHAVLQSAQYRQKMARSERAKRLAIELKRQPQLDTLVHEVKPGRHDPDHFMTDTVDLDRAADEVFARTENRPPQLVRQNDERRTTAARLFAAEPPAALRRHGERLKQFGVDGRALHTARLVAGRQIHLTADKSAYDGKGPIDLGQLDVFGRRYRPCSPSPELVVSNLSCSGCG